MKFDAKFSKLIVFKFAPECWCSVLFPEKSRFVVKTRFYRQKPLTSVLVQTQNFAADFFFPFSSFLPVKIYSTCLPLC